MATVDEIADWILALVEERVLTAVQALLFTAYIVGEDIESMAHLRELVNQWLEEQRDDAS